MLYSTTDLEQRGLRPKTGEKPTEIEFLDASHRVRHWWRITQATPINLRSEERAAHVDRTKALIALAEAQDLEVYARTDDATGIVRYQVYDNMLHRYVAGRDHADLPEPLSDGFELSLSNAEEFVAGYSRCGLDGNHPLRSLYQRLLYELLDRDPDDTRGAEAALIAVLQPCTAVPTGSWLERRLTEELRRRDVFYDFSATAHLVGKIVATARAAA